MAMLLSRPVSFPDIGISDQDQDPNAALLELDRGLKSSQIGHQCEAISRFPTLFAKYPFPILINSALLKLAEVFCQEIPGSNFVRVCVVEVIESCDKHLDKLINIDEFLKRITAVMHSNDPIARSLTLRTLGWMSAVVGENRQVHHLIRDALDAKDSIELQAAIFAAEKYAAKSKTFSMNMCDKLTGMISGLATPIDVKLQLIKVFQHMHHDAETAATVRVLCLKLLQEYPTQQMTITTLHTLTELAAHSLVDIPQQVDLLMEILESETRLGIRRAILLELDYLAQSAPHAWASHNMETLIKLSHSSLQNSTVCSKSLSVLSCLVSAPTFAHLSKSAELSMLELCRECINSINIKVACHGLQLLTNLMLYKQEEKKDSSLCEETLDAAVNLIQTIVAKPDQEAKLRSDLKLSLMCAVALAKTNPDKSCSLLQTLLSILSSGSLSDKSCRMISEGLASLGGCQMGALANHLPKLLHMIKQWTQYGSLNQSQNQLLNSLVTLVLQTFHCKERSSQEEGLILAASKAVNYWAAYRIGRQTSRYGHHKLAYSIYEALSNRVCSDQQHFWLLALSELSQGESLCGASGNRADNLMSANFHLLRSLSALKAASSTSQSLDFCQQYVKLRAEMMICHAQLLHACLSLRTAPPPAIAAPASATSAPGRDELLRCGRVSQQLAKSANDFNNLVTKYGDLYQSSFDADNQSLCNLALHKEGASLMAKSIELIIWPSGSLVQEFSGPDLTSIKKKLSGEETIESLSFMNAMQEATAMAHKLAKLCNEVKPVREQHLHLVQSVSEILTMIPLGYPRFFFQRLQNTSITLNLSPQPRTPSDPICVQTSGQLAVKVEGVIVHGTRPGLYRSVESVTLNVNLQIQNRPSHTLEFKVEPNDTLVQSVKPHNDFFSAQFLLGFPIPGIYQVTVETSVTDMEDDTWKTGPSLSLSIKAQEEPKPMGQTQQRPPPPPPQIANQYPAVPALGNQYSAVGPRQPANSNIPVEPLTSSAPIQIQPFINSQRPL